MSSDKKTSKTEQFEEAEEAEDIDKKQEFPRAASISVSFLSCLFTAVFVGAKLFLIIFDFLIPKSLREYVPFFAMVRKSTTAASEMFAGKKSNEVVEVKEELEELELKGQKVKKAYPLRRTIGQAISMGITPILLIVIPSAIWGEKIVVMISNRWPEIPTIVIGLALGTIMLIISWIVTVFGPLYVVFHNTSKIFMDLGAYRWAALYQDLENLFSIPYYAAKSSFSFFDAPPISSETYQEFKLDLTDEIVTIKEKVEGLLALDANNVPDRSKEMLEQLLKRVEVPIEKFDLTKVTKQTARSFALLIWSKESSFFYWRRKEAFEKFKIKNKLSEDDVNVGLLSIIHRIRSGDITDLLYKSVIVTGALKGIASQEKKYKQTISDIEYQKLALSLALGAQQYITDTFRPINKYVKIMKFIGFFFLGISLPMLIIIYSLLQYIKHLIFYLHKILFATPVKRYIKSLEEMDAMKYIGYVSLPLITPFLAVWEIKFIVLIIIERFREIKRIFTDTYFSMKEKGKKPNVRKEHNIDFRKFFKRFGKILLKIILLPAVLLWSLIKSIYRRLVKLFERRKSENKEKRLFEKEITTETLVAIYQELYDKFILENIKPS
ncbi:MAG: hypothetical protein HGN29_06165 [Asgard group archaeon]|nr:hypothetical protein [Asgard group archaeon]